MKVKIEKIINEYKKKIEGYDRLIKADLKLKRSCRKHGTKSALELCSNNIRRYSDIRQLCIQIISDLESII